ncbi:chromatin modification-related protein eaf-1 [Fopius arisanus]|uniref:Chromatin modification-related protein eaf-1 n=1 Tax=Fopius arisanus TaxID=64838 RepID=A0A9R1TGA1_9HYME|nr:PREDICTED: chromatin modification-related protein eaf-1-like [Fopius arisanus]
MRFIILTCLLALSTARRVQIRPRVTEPQVYYEDDDAQGEEEYSPSPEIYQPRTRALPSPRSKDTLNPSKAPPVQTIRNYNKVNDDGSFTFGYEAADGSFKEETRGTDCVVRGKYGYVDPDGNKREFTYVSGNPCDPNAPKEEEDDDLPRKGEDDDLPGPANYPVIRPRPIQNYPRTTTARAPTTIFQTEYALQDDDASQELEEEEPKVVIRPSTFRARPRPNYLQVNPIQGESLYSVTPAAATTQTTASTPYHSTPAPRYQSLASPTPTRFHPTPSYQALETSSTPRSIARERPQSVAITPRPHVQQVAAQYVSPSSTERPGVVYASQRSTTSSPPVSPNDIHLNFAAELERYVNTVPVTSRPVQPKGPVRSEPIYQSELVFDPSSGQYNTQLYQSLPQTIGDFRLNHKLQPYVAQPSQSLLSLQQLQPIQQASRPAPARPGQPQEAIYRQQQSEQLLQSQQLYAQQQRRQQQPAPQQKYALAAQREQQKYALAPQREQQYYYAVSPQTRGSSQALSAGQIDQFLRGSTTGF